MERPLWTTHSGNEPRRLRAARRVSSGVAEEMANILTRRMAGPLDDRVPDGGSREEPVGIGLDTGLARAVFPERSEEHTSELQSLMRISYAVFCLKKNTKNE